VNDIFVTLHETHGPRIIAEREDYFLNASRDQRLAVHAFGSGLIKDKGNRLCE